MATLDYLRKQSKSLLRRVHARDPEAVERVFRHHPGWRRMWLARLSETFKLADAQLVVARERGFRSWPQLKRAAAAGGVPRIRRPRNPYFDIVDSLRSKPHSLRAGTILSALPGRRPLENRGKPVSELKLEALVWGLSHDNARVRWRCLEILDSHPDRRAVPHIVKCLDDGVPRVRWHAVHALTCDGCKAGETLIDERVLKRIADLARSDPNPRVRSYAAREFAACSAAG